MEIPHKHNFSKFLNNISPEIGSLQKMAKNAVSSQIQHTHKIIDSKNSLNKIIANDIVELENNGAEMATKTINEVAKQINSIAEKTVQAMKESDNVIIKKAAQETEAKAEQIKETFNDIKQKISDIEQRKNDIKKEVIIESVKTKSKNIFIKFFTNLYLKIKQIFTNCKLFQ